MVAGTQVSLGSRNVARRGHWGHVWGQRREVQVVRVSAAPITHNIVNERRPAGPRCQHKLVIPSQ